AHLLTDPTVAPASALPWLGSWLGLTLAESIAPEQRRQAVARAMELYQWRGTLRGLALALDLATAGMATAGDLVVVEQFRLRRTFATILGADLADEEDPLTAGLVDSGNSLVGDTLLLGDEHHREFLALFQDRLPEPFKRWALEDDVLIRLPHRWRQEVRDVKTTQSFYARFAHRLTVLVHRDVDDDMLRRIQRVVDLEAPCGLDVTVVRASHPFIVGLASLAGVDTYLRNLEPVQPVVVGQSHLGRGAVLTRPASLDPRLEGGA
ncbi:MAG: phage tail protein, partial [Myxococcota bacterium]